MISYSLVMGVPEMQELYDRLTMDKEAGTLDPEEEKLAKKLFKTLVLLASDPRHNSLQSHEIDALTRRVGFKVFQSYLENRNPSAGRLFWAYGPGRGQSPFWRSSRTPRTASTATRRFASPHFPWSRRVEERALVGYNSRLGISRVSRSESRGGLPWLGIASGSRSSARRRSPTTSAPPTGPS